MKLHRMTVALLATTISVPALPAQNKAEAAGLAGLAHVAIRVNNVDSEVAFFGKMGYELAFANTKDGKTGEAYVKVNDVQFIELMPASPPQRPAGFADAGFESADLNALNAKYAAAGLKPTEAHKGGAGNLIFMVDDAGGAETVFTQYMPGSRHMNDKGQHLGVQRVSEELAGFDLPVKDMKASQAFYEALGFDAEQDGAELALSLPSNPDLRILLHPARANDKTEFLFSVQDAKRAANDLENAGLKVTRREKMAYVLDADGNTFVFIEPVPDAKRRNMPFHRKSE